MKAKFRVAVAMSRIFFCCGNIDVYLYLFRDNSIGPSCSLRANPPDPIYGTRFAFRDRPRSQRTLLQPQLLGGWQKPVPLRSQTQAWGRTSGHRRLPALPATDPAIRTADGRANARSTGHRPKKKASPRPAATPQLLLAQDQEAQRLALRVFMAAGQRLGAAEILLVLKRGGLTAFIRPFPALPHSSPNSGLARGPL